MLVVIFDTEWGHEWPLWSDLLEEPLLSPENLNLSSSLTADLRQFYDFWEEHDRPDEGWDLPGNQRRALDEADRLVSLLAVELAGHYEVQNGFRQTRGRRWP